MMYERTALSKEPEQAIQQELATLQQEQPLSPNYRCLMNGYISEPNFRGVQAPGSSRRRLQRLLHGGSFDTICSC